MILCARMRSSSSPKPPLAKFAASITTESKSSKASPTERAPSGANRFMAPAEPADWSGVRDALAYGHSAPQRDPAAPPPPPGALTISGEDLPAEGEDCLVLNIWTPAVGPAASSGRKRPVMFWCHGGGFATGSGSSPDNDGTNLARRGDVVVVTINHRLNVLGFANLSEFSRDFAASGDAGMLDIVQALKWVRANISQFGGDPNTVTIFGQSGGGRKVETLLAMPSAKGLFHRAIVESGAAVKVVDRDVAVRNAEQLLAKLGIDKKNVRELQKLPVEKIMAAYFAVVKEQPGCRSVDRRILAHGGRQDPAAAPILPQGLACLRRCAGDDRLHAHGDDAVLSERPLCVFAERRGHAQARKRSAGRPRARDDRPLPEAQSRRVAFRHLFLDRQRLPLRRAHHDRRPTARRARQSARVSVLLYLGDACAGRTPQVASHHGDSFRL